MRAKGKWNQVEESTKSQAKETKMRDEERVKKKKKAEIQKIRRE